MNVEKVSCLGPDGSYSALAAEKFGAKEIVLARNFQSAVELLIKGEVDATVLPIENSIQGGVLQNLDLLARVENIYAVEEIVLPVDHRLATLKEVKREEIMRVYSHEQAIGQCGEFLRRELPNAQIFFTNSTAESLSKLDACSAGIVGSHLSRAGVVLSQENIADEKCNFTHFLLVKRGGNSLSACVKKSFLCVTLEHRPNSLQTFLRALGKNGLNLTKIESRPISNELGKYRFFIEFEGDFRSIEAQKALKEGQKCCRAVKVLGAY